MKSLLFAFLLVYLFNIPGISQTPSKLTEADKQQRRTHGVDDLDGALEMVVVEESQFSADPNNPKEYVEFGRKHAKTLIFNIEGQITEIIERGQWQQKLQCGLKSDEQKKRTEIYDASGRKTGAIEGTYLADGKLIADAVYEYDLTEQIRELRRTLYDLSGSILFKWISKFDDRGHEVERNSYGQFGLLRSKQIFIRNEKGLVSETLEYSSNNSVPVNRTVMAYEYNTDGIWVKCTCSKWVKENSNSFFKPVKREYRTVYYFSQNKEK